MRDRSNLLFPLILYEPEKMSRRLRLFVCTSVFSVVTAVFAVGQHSCLDGFCIGQSIESSRFTQVDWITPANKNLMRENCDGVGCKPNVAFRGYSKADQTQLYGALSSTFGLMRYNVLTKSNLGTLRHYRYECNSSPRGMGAERRFIGVYLSTPSRYYTIIGLRLIGGDLKVYRIARQYPFHNHAELVSLAKKLRGQYGDELLLYGGISSNAYSDVIAQRKSGWFGRSTVFNPTDLSDNAAELVLIDPNTRPLLQPTSMPESGDISQLPMNMPERCSASIPTQ